MPECYICRRASSEYTSHSTCSYNYKYGKALDKVTPIWKYSALASSYMTEAKYKYAYRMYDDITHHVSNLLCLNLRHIPVAHYDYIVHVPNHINRTTLRGFEHTKIIAHNLSNALGIEHLHSNLRKIKDNKRQAEVDRDTRMTNASDSYLWYDESSIKRDAKILLVDDVMTTGSTLINSAEAIKKERPDINISGLTLFRGRAYHSKPIIINPTGSLLPTTS